MRVYVAAALADAPRANAFARALEMASVRVASGWHGSARSGVTDAALSYEEGEALFIQNLGDMIVADAFVLLYSDACRGSLIELGWALANKHHVIIVGDPLRVPVMARAPLVTFVPDDAAAVATLERRLYR